jgi:hypothetical protein
MWASSLLSKPSHKRKAGSDPMPDHFHAPPQASSYHNHSICRYLPALTPDPSALRPHVSAKDRLHRWTPSILAAANTPHHTTLASVSNAEKAQIRDTMLASWDDSTRTTYGVTHGSGTSLTACYRVVALLYELGLIGLRVTILGPLYYTALPHLQPLMEDCRWTGQSCD